MPAPEIGKATTLRIQIFNDRVLPQEVQKIMEKTNMPTLFSTWDSDEVPPTVAKYRIAYLALTVFPAPDSPDTMMD